MSEWIDRQALREAAAYDGPGEVTVSGRWLKQASHELALLDAALARLAALGQTAAPVLDLAA